MAYTAATDIPNLNFAQWSQPSAANPRLVKPIGATDTTIVITSAPKDHTNAVITGNFLMGIKNSDGYTETIYVPTGSSSDGLTFTSVIRGVWLEGLDYTTSDTTSKAVAFDGDSPVYFNISPVIEKLVFAALLGTIGSTYKLNARPTYSGTNAVHGERIFADTTARDAAITAPQNGDTCYVTADGVFYDYQGGAWASRATGSTPNASTTVAGKVEIATQAENDAGTTTGGTGALLVATPDLNAKSIQDNKWNYAASTTGNDTYVITLTPAPAAYVTGMVIEFMPDTDNTGSATINVNGLGAKTINKVSAGVAATLEDGDIQAGFIYSLAYTGTYFVLQNPTGNTMSTANSNTLTASSSSDADALHTHPTLSNKNNIGNSSVASNGSPGAVTYAHGLGVAPRKIQFNYYVLCSTSYGIGFSGNVDSDLHQHTIYPNNTTSAAIDTNSCIKSAFGTNNGLITGVLSSVDATNFTITWSFTAGSPNNTNLYFTWMASY